MERKNRRFSRRRRDLAEKISSWKKSICTGEGVIGFRDPKTKKLLQAVAARTPEEIADFYRSYGYEPPEK